MIEAAKGATNLRVAKVARAIENRDSAGKVLRHAKMAGAPRHCVAQLQQTVRDTANGPLLRSRCGSHVPLDAAGDIEAAIGRSGNVNYKFNAWHGSVLAEGPRPNRARSFSPALTTRRRKAVASLAQMSW